MPFYCAGPRIISGQRQFNIIIEGVQELPEIFGASVDVVGGIKSVFHAQGAGRSRHELHQTLCPLF